MKKADLEKLESLALDQLVKRRQLGEYSADAAGMMLQFDIIRHLLRHIIDNIPDDSTPKAKKRES